MKEDPGGGDALSNQQFALMMSRPGWKEAFIGRLRQAMSEASMDQRRLARAVGVSEAAVSDWLRGAIPRMSKVLMIATATGRPFDWLVGYEAAAARPEPKKADDWHLPKVAFAAAGSPIHDVLQDDATTWYAFRRGWIKHLAGGEKGLQDSERFIVVQVDKKHLGESMLPTIRPGAIVVVDRGPRGLGLSERKDIAQGKVYLVNVDGGLTIKRVFVDDGMLVLVGDNSDRERYPPQLVPIKGRELHKIIVGRVVWIGQEEV